MLPFLVLLAYRKPPRLPLSRGKLAPNVRIRAGHHEDHVGMPKALAYSPITAARRLSAMLFEAAGSYQADVTTLLFPAALHRSCRHTTGNGA